MESWRGAGSRQGCQGRLGVGEEGSEEQTRAGSLPGAAAEAGAGSKGCPGVPCPLRVPHTL